MKIYNNQDIGNCLASDTSATDHESHLNHIDLAVTKTCHTYYKQRLMAFLNHAALTVKMYLGGLYFMFIHYRRQLAR